MSVSEFSEKLGISPHTYKKIIEGEPVRFSIMRRVAEALGVKPPEIAEFARLVGVEDAPARGLVFIIEQ